MQKLFHKTKTTWDYMSDVSNLRDSDKDLVITLKMKAYNLIFQAENKT